MTTPSGGSTAKKGLAEQQQVEVVRAKRPRGPKATASTVGRAAIAQEDSLEPENRLIPTSKTEYWCYATFSFAQLGTGIGTDGGALRQALTSMAWPSGTIIWGHREIPLHAFLLDLTGLLFAIQLFVLLGLGSYADYGRWRYWLLIFFAATLITCMLGLSTLKQATSWKTAQAFWLIGCLSSNCLGTFYCASFPELVRNLPRMLASERAVKAGEKTPQDHAQKDMLERAKILNWVNTIGSASVVIVSAVAVIISECLGTEPFQLVRTYRVLLAYFAAMTLAFSLPYFITAKRRPGAKMPKGAKWYSLGPKQFYLGATHLPYLRQCSLYLLAYFCMITACDTSGGLAGIIQNEIINYSPRTLNTFAMLGNIAGGCGTFACLLAQKRWKFSIKQGCTYGAIMAIVPQIWGAIGAHTNKIGFHNEWEFWLLQFWNFQSAAWGSYNVTMISEVAPAPKMFLFFALFSTVGKTGGFIGPVAASIVIARAGGNTNVAFIFCAMIGMLGCFLIWSVDTDQAKVDNAALLRREDLGDVSIVATEATPLLDSIPEQ